MAGRGREVAEALGRVGVWSFALDRHAAEESRHIAADLETMGYRALWIPEGVGSKEAFAHSSLLLSATGPLEARLYSPCWPPLACVSTRH